MLVLRVITSVCDGNLVLLELLFMIFIGLAVKDRTDRVDFDGLKENFDILHL